MYAFASYMYLSVKGFVYQDGRFELVKKAEAGLLDFANKQPEEQKPSSKILARNVALNLPHTIIAGAEDAPLTIFEFSSLGCSHCADFHLNGLPKLEKDFLSKNKVQVVFIHFPLERRSMEAAMLAECINPQKRAEFLNLVFSKQREWVLSTTPETQLMNYAGAFGLTAQNAKACLKNDDLAKEIISNRQEAIDKLKIEGTPAFLISDTDKNEIIYGISNINEFKAYLNTRLEEIEAKQQEPKEE